MGGASANGRLTEVIMTIFDQSCLSSGGGRLDKKLLRGQNCKDESMSRF